MSLKFFRKKQTKHIRSNNYRYQFINEYPGVLGFYCCSYCGKIVSKKYMQVDHIVSIDYANRHPKYANFDINKLSNLTPSCKRCNLKKSNKGGLWIIRGKIGQVLQSLLWFLFLLCSFVYIHFVFQQII